jgi:N-formylglutamate deformylase
MNFSCIKLKKVIELSPLFDPMTTILHIPHDSYVIPSEYLSHFLFSKEEIEAEQLKMTDHLTSQLFQLEGAEKIIFPVSRMLLDPERFLDDAQEVMSQKGMGVIYTHSSDGRQMKRALKENERQELIYRFYTTHHLKLMEACEERLKKFNKVLIIDCHSFPKDALPYEDSSLNRPEICIGFDEFHVDTNLIIKLVGHFKALGLEVNLNQPFAGSLVPASYYLKDPRVQSIMIEVRRDVYLSGI